MALYCVAPHYRSTQPLSPTTSRPPSRPYRTQINLQVLAETHFDAYDFDLSLAVFHELCALFAPTSKHYFNIAQIHLLFGERRESESWFLKAITIDPFFGVALFQLGAINVARRRFDRARVYYEGCYSVVVRGVAEDAGNVHYDQLGMRYTLRIADIEENIRLCKAVVTAAAAGEQDMDQRELHVQNAVVGVPAGTIFRVAEKKAKARAQDPAKTAEWRFRDEARVVAEVPQGKPHKTNRRIFWPAKKW